MATGKDTTTGKDEGTEKSPAWRTKIDVRPWAAAWLKWPVAAGVIGILAVADQPMVFGGILGASLLLALWVATFRIRIQVDGDGGTRLKTRLRSIDLTELRSVEQSRFVGFPQISLRAGKRISIGGFGRWGPARWNRLLDGLEPYVRKCPNVDAASRKLWRIKKKK